MKASTAEKASTPDRPGESGGTPAAKDLREHGLAPQLRVMFQAYFGSPLRNKIIWLGVALVVVIGATAFVQIKLNAWNRPFYDALARKNLRDFLVQLVAFGAIGGALLVLNVAQAWLNQATKVVLRDGLVRNLFREWLRPKRAFRLGNAG